MKIRGVPKLFAFARQLWPLLGASAIFLAASAVLVQQVRQRCDGKVIYPLDDTYIHMALARNLAFHGTWGVTPGEFSSSSSSPLWTLCLAGAFALGGPNDLLPLALNIGAGIGLLTTAWYFGHRQQWSAGWNFAVLLGILILTPLPSLAVLGMEHVLQAWTSLALICLAVELFSYSTQEQRLGHIAWLFVAAVLACATRYEGLFLVFAVCVCAVLCRRPKLAVCLGLVSLIPAAAYAVVSLRHGSLWAPNSVLLKGAMPDFHSVRGIGTFLGIRGLNALSQQPHLLCLLFTLVALWLLTARRRQWTQDRLFNSVA
ncbi:MAG TPA: hypothetical protein VIK18_10840, partial [Pirellulales bacterium]